MMAGNRSSCQSRYPAFPASGCSSTKRRPVSARLFSTLERPRPRLLKRTRRAWPRHTLLQGTIGAGGKPLGQHGIDVVGDPGTVQGFGRVVQGIVREPVVLAQRSKGALPFQLLGARN